MISEIEEHLERLFNSFYSVYRQNYEKFADLFLMVYEHSTASLSNLDREIVKFLKNLVAVARAEKSDTLNEMKEFVTRYRGEYRHLYTIDCIGLPDLYAIWSAAVEKELIPRIKIFVNREARTVSFKEAFGAETIRHVATILVGQVIRKPDEMLHSEIFSTPRERNEFIRMLAYRMKYIASLQAIERSTMILSDHGYDVIRDDSKYVARHTHIPWMKIALARLAPVVLLK